MSARRRAPPARHARRAPALDSTKCSAATAAATSFWPTSPCACFASFSASNSPEVRCDKIWATMRRTRTDDCKEHVGAARCQRLRGARLFKRQGAHKLADGADLCQEPVGRVELAAEPETHDEATGAAAVAHAASAGSGKLCALARRTAGESSQARRRKICYTRLGTAARDAARSCLELLGALKPTCAPPSALQLCTTRPGHAAGVANTHGVARANRERKHQGSPGGQAVLRHGAPP